MADSSQDSNITQYVVDDDEDNTTYEFPVGTKYAEVVEFFKKKDANKPQKSTLQKIADSSIVTDINNFGDFLSDSGQVAVLNTAAMPLKFLPKNSVTDDIIGMADQANSDFDKKYQGDASAVGFKDALKMSSLAALPEADITKAMAGLMESSPELVTKVLSFISKKGSQGSLVGIAANDDPEKSEADAALSGAETNIAISSALRAAGKSFDYLTKAIPKALGQTVFGKELLDRIKSLNGEESTGGELLGSVNLQKIQANTLNITPFSGQQGKFDRIVKKLKEDSKKIYDYFLNGEDSDYLLDTNQKEIKEKLSELQAESGINYDKLDNYLQKKGIFMKFKNTDKVASELLEEYKTATELHAPALGNADIHSLLENYAGISEKLTRAKEKGDVPTILEMTNQLTGLLKKLGKSVDDFSGKAKTPRGVKTAEIQTEEPMNPSVKYAKIAKNEIYQRGSEENSAYRKRVYRSLSSALDKDIKETVSADSGAKRLLKKADDYYKNNLAKYYDSEVSGMTVGTEHPTQSFASFIKSGKNENPTKMEKYVSLLNKAQKKRLIAYSMRQTRDSDGTVSPQRLSNYWKNYGNRTKKALFGETEQKALDDLTNRVGLNKSALDQELNPPTGKTGNMLRMIAAIIAAKSLPMVVAPIILSARAGRSLLDSMKVIEFIAHQQMGQKSGQSLTGQAEKLAPVITRMVGY